MHALRYLMRAVLVVAWILLGLVLLSTVYRLLGAGARERMVRWWSRWLLRLSGIRMRVLGDPMTGHGGLWVANHVSWIDIFLLDAVRATSFIAKKEIRGWPVLGWLVAGAGTIFIERGNRRALGDISDAMHARFERGQRVGLFPEGTTTDGMDVQHFHAGLFEAALRAGATIQPVALRYYHHGKRSPFASYIGEETLLQNVWRIWGEGGVSVDVVFLPELTEHDGQDRQTVAQAARDAIAGQLRTGEGPRID